MALVKLPLALALGLALLANPALAGGTDPDDMFGDITKTQQQQGPGYDDFQFQQVLQQEFTDFHDVSKHRTPVRTRIRSYPGPYRFFDSDFDVFWDTVAFRSREAQGEGAALVTLMFKDVVAFDPRRSRQPFSVNRFVNIAVNGECRRSQPPVIMYGKQPEGFTGFDGGKPTASQFDQYQGTQLDKKTGSASSEFDFNLGVGFENERRPWDERISAGGNYADPFQDPILSAEPLVFRNERYVVGGYRGLYDFSRDRMDLVKNFLTRAANDSHYERLYSLGFFAPEEATTYRKVKQIISQKRMPALVLLPKQRDAVLVYRVVERGDGLGAMLYWRPSDPVNQRVAREIHRENIIWAVPTGRGGYQFIDRAELRERRFRWGNRSTVVSVPNLCGVYRRFASQLSRNDDDYLPPLERNPGKGDYYPPVWSTPPFVPPQDQYPDQAPRPRRPPELDWGIDIVFGNGGGFELPPRRRPRPPTIDIQPPRWDPMPPYRPPYDQYPPDQYPPIYRPPRPPSFPYRPPPKNPYCNKPVGTGRGAFVKIGFGYDETGYNMYGYDTAGLDREGFDPWGYDKQGYGRDGFNPWGYDRGGYNKAGFPLFNRARDFVSLVNQYHQNPFAFRMQFDITENGSIVRIIDGQMVWNNATGGPGGGPGVQPPVPVVAPPVPGPQKAEVPEWRTVTIKGKITGITPPYTIQIDRDGRHHILKDNKRTAIPRNIDVNADFQMQYQDAAKDYIFIQSTGPK